MNNTEHYTVTANRKRNKNEQQSKYWSKITMMSKSLPPICTVINTIYYFNTVISLLQQQKTLHLYQCKLQ